MTVQVLAVTHASQWDLTPTGIIALLPDPVLSNTCKRTSAVSAWLALVPVSFAFCLPCNLQEPPTYDRSELETCSKARNYNHIRQCLRIAIKNKHSKIWNRRESSNSLALRESPSLCHRIWVSACWWVLASGKTHFSI
jgi:hypothetical protein